MKDIEKIHKNDLDRSVKNFKKYKKYICSC